MWPGTRAARAVLPLAVLLLALLGLIELGRRQRPPELYRLGLVAPFEGLHRADGYAALEAVRARIQHWNQSYAAHGFQFQVWAVDDSNEPALARLRAEELSTDPFVLAVIGHMTPETSAVAAGIYAEAGLLQVSPVPLAELGADSSKLSALSLAVAPDLLGCQLPAGDAEEVPPSLRYRWLHLPGDQLWPRDCPPGSAAAIAVDSTLPATIRHLLQSEDPAGRAALPYGYCPEALLRLFPSTMWLTVASHPEQDPGAGAVASRAADLALSLISEAAEGHLHRSSVLHQASLRAEAQGWHQYDGAHYPPLLSVYLVPCDLGVDAR